MVTLVAFLFFNPGCHKDVKADPVAPDFSLLDLSGQMQTLSKHKGHVVILDFWATWCPPCRMSIPELVKIQEKYRDKGLTVIGVSIDDPHQASNAYIRAFREKFKINYTIVRYSNKVMFDYFGYASPSIPTMFVIDRDGKIRAKVVGFRPGALNKLLADVL